MKKLLVVILIILVSVISLAALTSCHHPHSHSPHNHTYLKKTVAATCCNDGYDEYYCTCGDSYKENYVTQTGSAHVINDYVCTLCDYFDPSAPCNEGLIYSPVYDSQGSGVIMGYSVIGRTDTHPYIKIPATYNNHPVIEIGDGAFKSDNSIVCVEIGNNVHCIGKESFKWCKGLKSVYLSQDLPRYTVHCSDCTVSLTTNSQEA